MAAVRRAVEGLEALKGETTLSLNDAVRRMVEFQAEHARSCAGYAQQGVFEKCNSFAAPPRGGRGGGGAGAPPRQAAGGARGDGGGGGGGEGGGVGLWGPALPQRRKGAVAAWLGAKARLKRCRSHVKKVAALPGPSRAFRARQARQSLRAAALGGTVLRGALAPEAAAPEAAAALAELRRHRRAARELVGALRQWSHKAKSLYAPEQRAYGGALRHLPSPVVDGFLSLQQTVHREELRLSDRLHGVAEGLQGVVENTLEPAIAECRELLLEVALLERAKAAVAAAQAQLAEAPEGRVLGLRARVARAEALASQRYAQALARMVGLVELTRSQGAGVPNGDASSWALPPLAYLRRGGDRASADVARHLGRAVTAFASCHKDVLAALEPWLEASPDPYYALGSPAFAARSAPGGAAAGGAAGGAASEGASGGGAGTKVPAIPILLAAQDSYVVQSPEGGPEQAEEEDEQAGDGEEEGEREDESPPAGGEQPGERDGDEGGGGGGAAAGEEAGDSGARASGLGQTAERWSPAGLAGRARSLRPPRRSHRRPLRRPLQRGGSSRAEKRARRQKKPAAPVGPLPRPPPRPMMPRRPLLQSKERQRSSTEPPKRTPSSGRWSAPSPPSGRQPRRPTVAVPQRPGLRSTTAAGEPFAASSGLRFQTSRTKPACRNTLATAPRMNFSIFLSRGACIRVT